MGTWPGSGLLTSTSHSIRSGSRKNRLSLRPKSVTVPSVAPRGCEPGPDLAEVLEAGRVQADVVEPAPTEHGRLVVGLAVAVDLEHVQLGGRADVDDGHARPSGELLTVELHGGPEHLDVERLEPVGVVGNDGHMVQSLREHQVTTSRFAYGVTA